MPTFLDKYGISQSVILEYQFFDLIDALFII